MNDSFPSPQQLEARLGFQETTLRRELQRTVRALPRARELLQSLALALEMRVLYASSVEVASRFGSPPESKERLWSLVKISTGLDANQFFSESTEPELASEEGQNLGTLHEVAALCDYLLTLYPKELLDQMKAFSDALLDSRIERALSWLRAFVYRHHPKFDDSLRALGPLYVVGKLSLSELSAAIQLPRGDLLPRLERLGFSRPLEALSDEERNAVLAKLRAKRLAGSLDSEPGLVEREVIASLRLEGHDVRPWLASRPLS